MKYPRKLKKARKLNVIVRIDLSSVPKEFKQKRLDNLLHQYKHRLIEFAKEYDGIIIRVHKVKHRINSFYYRK